MPIDVIPKCLLAYTCHFSLSFRIQASRLLKVFPQTFAFPLTLAR
jgi:hypothetical protein